MELDSVLKKVQQLIQKAEAPIAPQATDAEREAAEQEQKMALQMADALMLKYAIDRARLRDAAPAASRMKPDKISLVLCDISNPLKNELAQIVWAIATFTRTEAIVFGLKSSLSKENIEWYHRTKTEIPPCRITVYGFESDLRFYEILYTTIMLHAASGIDMEWDYSESIEYNAYRLHNAGYNWRDIARMRGWDTGQVPCGKIKRAYYKACAEHGTKPLIIAASGRVTFRRNYIRAFASRLNRRFAEAMNRRDVNGAALVLRSSMDAVKEMMNEENPKVKENKSKRLQYNHEAWQRGTQFADTADIQGTRVGADATRRIEA